MKILLSLIAALAISACSSQQVRAPVTPAKKILSVRVDAPAVSDLGSGREKFDVVTVGRKPLTKDPVFIPSTAHVFEEAFLQDWEKSKNIRARTETYDFGGARPEDLQAWAKANKPGFDYIADTSIKKWGVKKHPKDSSLKVVYLSLDHKLTDLKTGKVVVSKTCNKNTQELALKDAPSNHTLLKNDRALLKKIMRDLTLSCVEDLTAKPKKGA